MTFVCHPMYTLCQPYLFRKLVFYPYSKTPAGSLVPWPYQRSFNKRMEFLQFRPRITESVTHFTISPPNYKPNDSTVTRYYPMDSVLDAIFDMLPNFQHLTTLVCNHVELTPRRMICLRVLRLRTITLESCSAVNRRAALELDAMPLETVYLASQPQPGSSVDSTFLSLFLNPPYLRRLYSNPGDAILAALLHKEKQFLPLTDLDISLTCVSSAHFIPVLRKCPHLKRLSIHQDRGTHDPKPRKHKLDYLPSVVIPEVNFYRGPHAYIPKLLERRKVKTIEVAFSCRPESFLKASYLVDDCHRQHVDSLTIPPSHVPLTFLGEILILYPRLRVLNVNRTSCTPSEWRDRFSASEITPPPNIRVFRFEVQTSALYVVWENPRQRVQEAVLSFAALFPSLLSIFPLIHKIQMVYSNLIGAALVWRKDEKGLSLSSSSDIRVEIDINRPELKGRRLSPEEAVLLTRPHGKSEQ